MDGLQLIIQILAGVKQENGIIIELGDLVINIA